MKENKKNNAQIESNQWWEELTEDEQIWIMMQHGFENFNPKKITADQILQLWELENP